MPGHVLSLSGKLPPPTALRATDLYIPFLRLDVTTKLTQLSCHNDKSFDFVVQMSIVFGIEIVYLFGFRVRILSFLLLSRFR